MVTTVVGTYDPVPVAVGVAVGVTVLLICVAGVVYLIVKEKRGKPVFTKLTGNSPPAGSQMASVPPAADAAASQTKEAEAKEVEAV